MKLVLYSYQDPKDTSKVHAVKAFACSGDRLEVVPVCARRNDFCDWLFYPDKIMLIPVTCEDCIAVLNPNLRTVSPEYEDDASIRFSLLEFD